MSLAVVTLKKGEGRFLKSGGMWVFDNEIASVMGSFVNGDIVLVHDFDGYPLGRGFINRNSKITIRLLTRNENQKIDEDFFEKRVRDAWEYRKKVTDTSSCRVIFGEADFFPGLVVDKFEDVLVVQSLALGIDRWKELILDLIKKVLSEDGITIRGVYERSDAKVRKQEGMELYKGFIGEEFPTLVEIQENGVRYQVDVKDGQKTGFFLDQKYNRLAIQKLCKDARVLDCFTHTGSFALNAGIAGAKEVTGVDASELAVHQAQENAKLNGLDKTVKFICEDVFELLPKLEEQEEKYDVVIDIYIDGQAYTAAESMQLVQTHVPESFRPYFLKTRRLVENREQLLRRKGRGAEKFTILFRDMAQRAAAWQKFEQTGLFELSGGIPENIEVNAKGVDKGRALLALAGRLGFSRGQTMACGDASNDIAMLRAAGLGVAMGNATPEAVAAADVQTDTNNNDGVAKAIRRWVLGEEV